MKGTDRDFRSHVCRWLAVLSLACFALSAHAVNKGNIGKASVNQSGNSAQIGPAGMYPGGSQIPVSPNIGGWTTAGNYGFPTGATGATMNLGTTGDVFFAGQKYKFQAGYTVPRVDLVNGAKTALGAVATGGCSLLPGGIFLGVACATAVSSALPYVYQWIQAAGARFNPTTGSLERVPTGAGYCYTLPCYQFKGLDNAYYRSADQACKTFNATHWATNDVDGKCLFPPSGAVARVLERQNATAMSPTWYPSSMDDIAPYMQNTAPDGRVAGEIIGNGGELPLGTPTVTGPSSIQGPETVRQNADGTKEVSRTTYNFNTAGNTITNTTNVTTTNYYNSSNVQTGTRTDTTTPTPQNGAPPPTQEEDKEVQCDKYPDSLGCAELDMPEAEIPKETRTITYTPETPFGGGSCPADKHFSSALAGRGFKAVDWVQWCSYAPMIRALVILLATISAFFIVSLGKDAE